MERAEERIEKEAETARRAEEEAGWRTEKDRRSPFFCEHIVEELMEGLDLTTTICLMKSKTVRCCYCYKKTELTGKNSESSTKLK